MLHDANSRRQHIGSEIAARKRQDLGPDALAGAIYGSVAHQAAQEHSDVELIIVVADTLPYQEEMLFEAGIMVECTIVPQTRLLAAARRVTPTWGIQADQYRHHLVLWDDSDFFPQLWAAALDLAPSAFMAALAEGWWIFYEVRGKVLNALTEQDLPRALYLGWEFAYLAAMRFALYQQVPYESLRTLWQDVIQRGFAMGQLIAVLTTGDGTQLAAAMASVWEQTGEWGKPRAE